MAREMATGWASSDVFEALKPTPGGGTMLEALQLTLSLGGVGVFRRAFDPEDKHRGDADWDRAIGLDYDRWTRTGILPDEVIKLHSEQCSQVDA